MVSSLSGFNGFLQNYSHWNVSNIRDHVAGNVCQIAGTRFLVEDPCFLVDGVKAFSCHCSDFFFGKPAR